MLYLNACLALILTLVKGNELAGSNGLRGVDSGAIAKVVQTANKRVHAAQMMVTTQDFRSHVEKTSFNMEGCGTIGDSCLIDSGCCGDLECLGVVDWQCGNNPAQRGEYCNAYYLCAKDLICHEGTCHEYADILHWDKKSGICKPGSPAGQIKVMTYNTFLLDCDFYPLDALGMVPCQYKNEYQPRIEKLLKWIKDRDEDVVMVQEMFNLRDEMVAGMAEAGFCHHVATAFGQNGDGLGIFSKYPITAVDFLDWNDLGDEGKTSDAECMFSDKGIMYAKVEKDGTNYHLFDTHTKSNSAGEEHPDRMVQYATFKEFARNVVGETSGEMILFGGDFNEDKFVEDPPVGDQYYLEMLQELNAIDPVLEGDQVYTYDTVNNPLPDSFQEAEWRQRLDYILVSKTGLQPTDSSCRILMPSLPAGCNEKECMLSDHFPVTCTYTSQAALQQQE